MTRAAPRSRLVARAIAGWPVWLPLLAAGLIIVLIAASTGRWRAKIPAAPAVGRGTAGSAGRPDPNAERLMDALISTRSSARGALAAIVAAHDPRFLAVLLEVLRASQLGVLHNVDPTVVAGALQTLSEKRFGDDWLAWADWYSTTTLVPPVGFAGWKGRLFARIDPRFRAFFSDDLPRRLRVEEVQWGGVGVDGVPVLTRPRLAPASFATHLAPADPVFGLAIDGYARAYPMRVLDRHELINDRVGGTPVSIAYCALCGAGIAYGGRATDGRTYTFGSSGLLYRSNKLIYDHETRTLWNQLTGEPVLGRLAGSGTRLVPMPLVLTSWRAWVAEHPETKVLDAATGRVNGAATPYTRYFAPPELASPRWRRGRALPAKARVFALRIGGTPKAFAVDALLARRVVNDAVGGLPVVLIAWGPVTSTGEHERGQPDPVRAAAVAPAGAEVRAFGRGAEQFGPGPGPGIVLDASGRPWRVTEDALIGPDGRRASRVPGFLAYWFAWYAFFPQTLVYVR